MFRRFYVQKVLCSEGPMFRRFYVQKVLYSEGSMLRRFYVQKYLFRRSYVLKVRVTISQFQLGTRRWINVNDFDLMSQKRCVPSGFPSVKLMTLDQFEDSLNCRYCSYNYFPYEVRCSKYHIKTSDIDVLISIILSYVVYDIILCSM